MTNQEIVTKFLNGFNHPEQMQASLDLLAEDYQFQNPMVQLQTKAEFIALAKEIGKVLTGIHVIRMAENGEWVAVFYEFTAALPNTATEWFQIKGGLIQASHLIYDASEWRKLYAQMER